MRNTTLSRAALAAALLAAAFMGGHAVQAQGSQGTYARIAYHKVGRGEEVIDSLN